MKFNFWQVLGIGLVIVAAIGFWIWGSGWGAPTQTTPATMQAH